MYKVSDKFRERVYSGGALYNCKLKIDNQDVPISQIAKITISNPIIDTSSETFYVGSFISQKITIKFKNLDNLTIYSGEEVSLTIGLLVDDDYEYVPIGKFIIDDLGENYQETCEISCLDYAVKMKPNIDYSPCFVQGKATIDTILEYICNQFGVELDSNYPKTNGNIEIGTYDSTVSGKRWVSYIAEIKGCNAKIGRDGVLYLIPLKNSVQTRINALKSKSWELGTQYQISKVTFDDGARPYSAGDDTKNTLYIRNYNPFIKDQTTIDNIYNVVKDTVIWNLTTENYGDISLDPWDNIAYDLGDNSYNTLMNVDITYEMNIMSKNEVKIPTKQQEVTTNVVGGDDNSRYLRIGREIDLINGTIRDIVEKTIDVSQKASGVGSVNITNGYKGNLHKLDIYGYMELPIIGSIIIGQFKVNNFKITVEQNNEVYREYIVDDMKNLYQVGTVHDTFEYLDGKCSITKRIGIDDEGNKYVLETPYTIDLKDFVIEVPDGDYKIYTNFDVLHLDVEYLIQNEYTDIFATKVDVTNEITTSVDGVLIKSTTYTDKNINDGNKLIASINTKSSGDVLINASKLTEINANKINFNSYDFNVTTQNMKISIGQGDNKKDIINANGVLTNLMFSSSNQIWGAGQSGPYFLGFSPTGEGNVDKSYLMINYDLPPNFVPQEAYISIYHSPVYWDNGDYHRWGYCRNLGIYNATNNANILINAAFFGEGFSITDFGSTLISDVFDTGDYWTPSVPSNSSHQSQNKMSKNIIGNISSNHGTLIIQSSDSNPSWSNVADLYAENGVGAKTGMAYATLNIIGYTKV